jgi:ATP-dependent DNA helicase RecQ
MSERVKVMVATNAFGMGIDKANVRLVVHHAMPGSLEAYYQEAGRAGRNGQRANCVLLHAFQDRFTHEFLINNARAPSDARSESLARNPASDARRRNADLAKLDIMQRYAYAKGCRRAFILRYFGDPAATGQCDGCDNCLGNHRSVVIPRLTASKLRRPATDAPRHNGASGVAGQRRASADAATLPAALRDADAPLFEALRTLRAEIAKRDGVPAYVVFPDRTLIEMATRRPRSVAALADVRGVGPVKLERYGEQFLNVVLGAAPQSAGPASHISGRA